MPADSYQSIIEQLTTVRDERRTHANTATRVGEALLALLQYMRQTLSDAPYLRKDQPDSTEYLLTLLAGALIGDSGQIRLNPDGSITCGRITVLGSAVFNELVINHQNVLEGDTYFCDRGIIDEVRPLGNKQYLLTMRKLYDEEVVSAQKRDEAEAMYKSAQAQVKAAQSQYDMAVNGARQEERRAASATVGQARGAVQEVEGYIRETVQTAQMDGEVTDVYPKVGELVGTGTPIMSIAVMDDAWATFNIREDQLKNVKTGSEITVSIPALEKELTMKVYYIKDKGSFAVWKATKASGQYDQKTFEVKARPTGKLDGVRPGMSVILKQ